MIQVFMIVFAVIFVFALVRGSVSDSKKEKRQKVECPHCGRLIPYRPGGRCPYCLHTQRTNMGAEGHLIVGSFGFKLAVVIIILGIIVVVLGGAIS